MRFGTANAKSFTVSFSILATGASAGNVTGTYCVNATNFGNYDRAYVKEYTIDAVDTWKKVTLTFPGCTDGTWGTGNTGGIRLGWFFAGPTSQQGAANQWHTSYKGSTTNQKNGMGVVNNFYFIKDIQVEEGTIATPFERRSYGEELTRCQRYYEKSYKYEHAPGTATDDGRRLRRVCASATNQTVFIEETFKVTKRASPSVTTYSSDGTSGKMFLCNYGSTSLHVTGSVYGKCDVGFEVSGTGDANGAAVFWTASAEL